MVYNSVVDMVGNTPLLRIDPKITGLENIELYAKLESFNPFGSLKDRIAWGILKDSLEDIRREKQTVIESSSGNSAKAMQAICSIYGIPFKTVTNRIKVPEVKSLLQIMGAEIEELPGLSECPDPTDPNDPLTYLQNIMVKNPNKYFHTAQYTNTKNYQTHYETTGPEINNDLGMVDYFIGSLGTAGSSRGTIAYLKEMNPNLQCVGVIASKGDFIPGIRNSEEMLEVGIFDKNFYTDIKDITALEAIDHMLVLIRKCGLTVGPTSGATFGVALKYLREQDKKIAASGEKCQAVFIVCDRLDPYVSYIQKRRPDLFNENRIGLASEMASDGLNEFAQEIDIENVTDWIKEHTPLIVDIRGPMAYRLKHVPDSINIPEQQLAEILEYGTAFDNKCNVLLICPRGERSLKFSAVLKKRGVNAFSLKNGIIAWKDKNYPLEGMVA